MRDAIHTLLVTAPDDDDRDYREYELRHPGCSPVEPCATQHEWDAIGVDALGLDHVLDPGSYHVQGWWQGPDYFGEHDGGIDLITETTA